MYDGFYTETSIFVKHLFVDFVAVGLAGRFENKDFVVGIGGHRVVGEPAF